MREKEYRFTCCVVYCVHSHKQKAKNIESAKYFAHKNGWASTSMRKTAKDICPIHARKFTHYEPSGALPFKRSIFVGGE
jgi:hypothetical protein